MLVAFSCQNDAQSGTDPDKPEKPLAHLLERYLKPYPDKLSALANPEKDTLIIAAMKAYNAGSYAEAIELLPNFATSLEQASYIHLYKGISELLVDQEYDAFKSFQRIQAAQENIFEISNWYVAMNYVAYNNVYEARQKLEAIVADNAYGAAEAKDLLNDLPEK